MSESVQIALIAAVPVYITTLAGIYFQMRGLRREMNGMKDHLVKVTGESEHAKGKIEGAQEEKDKVT